MPLEQYNSKKETDYLLASPANQTHLESSLAEAEKVIKKTLPELAQYE